MRKGKKAETIFLLCALLCFIGQAIGASVPEPTSKIAGMVLDKNEARIVDAAITVTNGRVTYRAKSDQVGEFTINLPPGEYHMKISANGFRAYSTKVFSVRPNESRNFKVTLQVATSEDLVPAVTR